MKLTNNFTLSELTYSVTANKDKVKYEAQFNPPVDVVHNLRSLCTMALQPIRDKMAKPIRLSSGWRCRALNIDVGGVKGSAHERGLAADIRFSSLDEAFEIVNSAIAVGCKRIGLGKNFIHIDIDYSRPTPAVFTYKNTPKKLAAKKDEFKKQL